MRLGLDRAPKLRSTLARALAALAISTAIGLVSGPAAGAANVGALNADERQAIHWKINEARSQGRNCGATRYAAAPLIPWNLSLEAAAQRHSNDMANRNFFSHTGSDGLTLGGRLRWAGYPYYNAAEDIAAGYTGIDTVVQGWLDSPSHCVAIMNPALKELGAARATNPASQYGTYWTLDLAAR